MDDSDLPTRAQPAAPSTRPPSALLPGTLLAGRFRVVAPLGHGGMGDVYRADDLKLGQAVALKFLPPAFRNDEARRQRLRDEVKIARLVAHPNVCRVWDLVEADGHEFLAMEYVDGEDLASVLRRIGRLPEERAVRMARELCAGLSAIHEQGILHRDLKPANVMVDGRGRVRIADFGLAALAESVSGAEASAGTPAYMSPEQREGREVTVRSDVYALGLVLYEVFTGKAALTARMTEEPGSHPTPSSPSSHVKELDPAIDRAIERCLEPDPALRPPSVMAVAASLPGGDPLAAALAAGETPSPELVAAAGETRGLRPAMAWGALGIIVAGVALVAWVGDRVSPFYLDLDKPPELLAYEARQIIDELGPPIEAVDSSFGFGPAVGPLRGPLHFWYRESPRRLSVGQLRWPPGVSFTNPPPSFPGMAGVRLDASGRLVEYVRVPAPGEPATKVEPDWGPILERAGLDSATLQEVTATPIPPVFGDDRRAWTSDRDGRPVRVEAASLRGRPVWFRVADPEDVSPPALEDVLGGAVYVLVVVFLLAVVLARRHLRSGRGDREGARRIAAFGLVLRLLVIDPRALEPSGILLWLEGTLFFIVALWTSYLALEPLVRRRWPETLVSWTRLLRGRVRDPLVGTDVLVGVMVGIVLALLDQASNLHAGMSWPVGALVDGWHALAHRGTSLGNAVWLSLAILMLLALLRQALRRTWAAVLAIVVLNQLLMLSADIGTRALGSLQFGAFLALMARRGLLALVVALSVQRFLAGTLMTTHLDAWYAASAISGIVATLAFAAWGFYASLGGRPPFGDASEGTA